LRGDLLRGLVTGWVRSGPVPEALKGLDGFLVGVGIDHQDDGIKAAVQELVRSGGAEAVLAWVDPILRDASDRPRFKESLFRISLRALARWDPERGSAWAAEHVGKDYAEVGPLLVGGQWGARDGAAALAWLRDLPDGEARDRGVHRAMVRWLRADPAAARDWLESQSPEAFHAPAIEAYAEELVKQAPDDALGWCDRIPDPERARRCVQDVAGRWYFQDAAAAEAWLEQSPLDEEARSAVRMPRRRRPAGAEGLRAGARSR
jgi:hypothetical protein